MQAQTLNEVREKYIINVRKLFKSLNDSERMEFVEKILDGYCPKCGSSILPCYCWRDE